MSGTFLLVKGVNDVARNWDTFIKSKITNVSLSLVMSCLASQVFASGFQIQEQNVTNLGLAYSGTAALAEDASTGWYNAAGLTRLGESQIVLSANLIQGNFDFTASSAKTPLPVAVISLQPVRTAPGDVPGENTDDPGTTNFVPAFYISKRLDDRWVVGFNVTAPFGLNSEYKETGIARYLATKSSLETFNFSPSIAYQIFKCLSFGIGPDAQFGKARLDVRIGDGNATRDGFQKNRAEGWGYGWHAGILWSPWDTTRLGLTYRSHVNFHGEGYSENQVSYAEIDAGIADLTLFGDAAGTYTLQRVRADITLPETWTLSLYHAFNQCLALTADAAWTNWSRFHTLRLRFQPGASIAILPQVFSGAVTTAGLDTDTWEHFKDARRVALGLIYTMNTQWLFRIGSAYDQSPVRDDFRTARLPDSDRVWAAIGGAYTLNRALRIDFGYAYLFFDDASLNERSPFIAGSDTPISSATLVGNYDSNANIVGIQMRYDFV